MATSSRNLTKTTLLPPAMADFLRRRTVEAAGIAVALAGVGAALALISYHPGDPSLNAASAAPVRNWLGAAAHRSPIC
jgi:S-DNA-T family DNA segregation ATPase FtsK/SpoIIIE